LFWLRVLWASLDVGGALGRSTRTQAAIEGNVEQLLIQPYPHDKIDDGPWLLDVIQLWVQNGVLGLAFYKQRRALDTQ
jgi:hypothetical protein